MDNHSQKIRPMVNHCQEKTTKSISTLISTFLKLYKIAFYNKTKRKGISWRGFFLVMVNYGADFLRMVIRG